METQTVNLLLKDFEKHQMIGDKSTNVFKKGISTRTTTTVNIGLKSGREYKSKPYFCYLVIKYPSQKDPIVKISLFFNSYDRVYDFSDNIISIPMESIESVGFGSSGKVGFRNFHKNKGKL